MSQKKYASLTTLQAFLTNLKNLFATKASVDELSADVAYINVEDNENITDVETGGTGNTTSVQPNWNQNDPTAPDYVKNRLAWTDDPVETVLLEETELTFVDGGAELPTPIQLTEGQTYVVTYNGNVYDCTAWLWEVEGIVFIGNGALVDESVENDKPFITDGALMMSVNADASATIRIIEVAAEVHKIDEKYLPRQTHYDNRTMLVDYDGNYEDVISDANGNVRYRYLTSDTFTVEELINKRMDYIEFGERYSFTIVSDVVEDINGDGTLISVDSGTVIICNTENTVFNDITFPYKGLYVMSPDDRGCDYALQIYEGSYKQLDEKYLPDRVRSDIENAQTTADEAKATADETKTMADEAKTMVETAQATADEAKTTAETAQAMADEAKTMADEAIKFIAFQEECIIPIKDTQLSVGETTMLSEEYDKSGIPSQLKTLKAGDMMSLTLSYVRDDGTFLLTGGLIVTHNGYKAVGGLWVSQGVSSPHYYHVYLGHNHYNSSYTRMV
jgi:hypothetical protein